MHLASLELLFDKISNNEFLPDDQRQELLMLITQSHKDFHKKSFQLERTLKDKEIAQRLLKTTVDNLASNNQLLESQKNLLETHASERETYLKAIENSYQELEQFSYIASHDLKSPLRNIASYAQLLKRRYQGKLDDQADEFIHFIVSGVTQMNDVITNLLEYSQIGVQNQRTFTNLEAVLDIVESNLQSEIEDSGAQIIRENKLPEVNAIQGGMVQLFQHLVSNALKFRAESAPILRIEHQIVNNFWQIKFQDNGIGIDPIFEKKVFQPFQRLNLNVAGNGMGLAICRKIVRKHGGEIWFEPNETLGTTFYFSLQMTDF